MEPYIIAVNVRNFRKVYIMKYLKRLNIYINIIFRHDRYGFE